MKLIKTTAIALLAAGFLFSGCAVKQCKDIPGKNPPVYDGGSYTKKIDNLIIIADTSSSMEQCADNQTCFSLTQNIITNMISGLPSDIDINTAYLTFGHLSSVSTKPNLVNSDFGEFSKSEFTKAAALVQKAGGTSRLDLSLGQTNEMLKNASGKTALFIFGDGVDIEDKSFAAVNKIKDNYSGKVCIYPVHAGNSAEGEKAYAQMSEITGCGKLYKAENLNNNNAVMAMLNEVVYDKASDADKDGVVDSKDKCPDTPRGVTVDKTGCPVDSDGDGVYDNMDKCKNTPKGIKVDKTGCPLDSDGDGVYDSFDQCPNTKKGVKVDKKGCPVPTASDKVIVTEKGTWIYKDIQFATSDDAINAKSAAVLDEVAVILKENKNLKLEIQGHTDNRGNEAYNNRLSQERADSVKKYLTDKGIPADRLKSKGYGPSQPAAANDTAEGRALNRRVEFKPFN
jgi:OOP family OmpA-OmpF porin